MVYPAVDGEYLGEHLKEVTLTLVVTVLSTLLTPCLSWLPGVLTE